MNKNEENQKDRNRRYLAAGKGISRIFSKIANNRFHFSRPPVSTTHPLLRLCILRWARDLRNTLPEGSCILVPFSIRPRLNRDLQSLHCRDGIRGTLDVDRPRWSASSATEAVGGAPMAAPKSLHAYQEHVHCESPDCDWGTPLSGFSEGEWDRWRHEFCEHCIERRGLDPNDRKDSAGSTWRRSPLTLLASAWLLIPHAEP